MIGPGSPGITRRTTDNQTGDIKVNNELRAEEGRDRSHINMPPIRGERQALDPFRAVNEPVRPFVGHLRLVGWDFL